MSLNGGLNRDVQPYHQPKNSWREARNILISKGFNSVTNEEGFDLVHTVTDKTIIGVIKLTNDLIIFSTNDVLSEIGIIEDNGNYQKIIDSIHLNFKKENPIEGVAKRNYKNELIVAWCDGLNESANPPRLLNLTNLPFNLDNNLEFTNSKDKKLTYLIPEIDIPIIKFSSFLNGGESVKGTLQFAIAYNYKNEDTTHFIVVSNPIANNSDTASITLKITNLDISFSSFKLVLINRLATETNLIEIGDYPINLSETLVTYSGQNKPTILTLEDVLLGTTVFKRIQTMTTLKGELIVGNVEINNFNYQCYANNITVEWDVIDINKTQSQVTQDFENGKYLYYKEAYRQAEFRTFMPNEVYALYINLIYNDGTISEGFHIPGRLPKPSPFYTTIQIQALPNPVTGQKEKNSDTNTYWVYIGTSWLDGGITETILISRTVTTVPYYNLTIDNEIKLLIKYDNSIPATANSIVMGVPFNIYQTYFINLNGTQYKVKSYKTVSSDIINNINIYEVTLDEDINIFNEPIIGNYEFFDYNDHNGEDKLLINNLGTPPIGYSDIINNNYLTSNYHILDTTNTLTSKLGFWKNLNEKYPSNNNSKIRDENSNIIGDLGGQNVRHHKMPTNGKIYKMATEKGIVTYTTTTDKNQIAFALKLKNVPIPNELIGKIKGYTLSYAKRDNKNQTVLGQSIAVKSPQITNDIDDPNGTRWYPKELLEFKPTFNVDFYKVDFYKDASTILTDTLVDLPKAFKGTIEYKPTGSANGNPLREAHLQLVDIDMTNLIGGVVSGNINSNPPIYAATSHLPVISLHKVITDVFSPYSNQSLVTTNQINTISNTITLEESKLIFGGDTYIRSEDIYINTDNQTNSVYDRYVVQQEVFTYINPNYQDNDPLYNSVNDLNSPITFNPKQEGINKIKYRIYRSIKNFDESLTIGWRTFLVNNFYNMPKDKGEIWKLEVLNRTLIIQHKFALFIASIKDILKSDNITSYLGTGDIFDREPDEIAPEDNGYIGGQSKFASFTCKLGYVTVDRNQGKIFIYSGQNLSEINLKGLRNFFRDNLETTEDIDNPFIGMGITTCYDEKYNRLLVSKNINKNTGNKTSFTLSYSPNLNQNNGGWVSLHDYIPNHLVNTRNKVYSITENGEIYKHNIESKKGIYYNNITYPSLCDVVFLGNTRESKIWEAIYWNSTIIQTDNTKLRKQTITHILIYNDYQCSGVINLNDNQSWFLNNINGSDEQWTFNSFNDIVKDKTLPFIDKDYNLILSNLSENISWFTKNKFIGKFGIVRFIYDNSSQNDFYLNDVNFKNREFNK